MERGIARRRLPHQHANRPARTSHFLAVLLMPRCLVKHSLHPAHGVFRTLSAYFSGVFLSECLWNAVSSQPGAEAHSRVRHWSARPPRGTREHPAGWRGQRNPQALPKNPAALGLTCNSLGPTAPGPCPAEVPRVTNQPHEAPWGHWGPEKGGQGELL